MLYYVHNNYSTCERNVKKGKMMTEGSKETIKKKYKKEKKKRKKKPSTNVTLFVISA